jgi:hypothetical protein
MGSLPPNFVGKANLIVASSGLATMQQMLDLLPADEAASVLVVRLAGMSSHSCSTTTLETHATAQ